MKRKIDVAFTFDATMWMIAGVSIYSLCKNSGKNCKYNIYCVVDTTINSAIRNLIADCVIPPHKIQFIDFNDSVIKHASYWTRPTSFPKSAMYRLFLPKLLPKKDKIIYIDTDTIIAKDLIELDKINIKNHLIAAVPDYSIMETIANKQELTKHFPKYGLDKMARAGRYINSGVLIMNLKKFRQNYITQRAMHIFEQGPGFWCCDQDTLNIVCANQILYLPFRFNRCGQAQWDEVLNFYMSHGNAPKQLIQDFFDFTILHFVGLKPWTVTEEQYCPHEDIWWSYAAQTPFFERLQVFRKRITQKH
ncbi:MAG: hypothetical protein IJD41_00425 [Alphaproteobacteria bacterium]|nr:hypothetical protein [Alphaproteobacteria bacterium]